MTKKNVKATEPAKSAPVNFVFGRNNYRLLIIGMVVILIGYLLMIGDENILSFRKVSLAPMVIVAGFVVTMIAILQRPKDSK